MLRIWLKRSLIISTAVVSIVLVLLCIRSIWFAADELLVTTSGDFRVADAIDLSSEGWKELEVKGTFYSIGHGAGSLRLERMHPDPSWRLLFHEPDIVYQSRFAVLVDRPAASPQLDRQNWFRWQTFPHGWAVTVMGFHLGVTLPHDVPLRARILGLRQGLVVQLPLPLLAALFATPSLIWLWRQRRRRRQQGFEVAPLEAPATPTPRDPQPAEP